MSDSIGKVKLDLETNYSGFQQQLNGISGNATGMVSSAFKKLGGVVAGAFAVGKLIQFGKASIDLASNLAEVQNVVDVVFGESAGQIDNFAKSALTSYGLSELSAKKYSSTMGAMLKSMGLSQDAVLDMSQSITGLAGDMASFYNLSSDDAFNKIRAGISGETEPLKQLGINMSQANLEAFALSQGITKSIQSMSQSEQALLRYNYLLSTTTDAQGDFARTSDSWANQTRILQEQFNSLKATLGSAFIAVLTPVVKFLNQIIAKLQIAAEYFKAFVESITGSKVDNESATSAVSDGFGGITAGAETATEAIGETQEALLGLAGFDKLNVLSSSGEGSEDASDALSSGLSGSTSGATLEIPEPSMTVVDDFIARIKQGFTDLGSWFTSTYAPSIKAWGDAFKSLKQPVKDAFDSVSQTAVGFWEGTLKPFGGYLINDYVPSIYNAFSENFAPIFSDVAAFALQQFASDFEFACTQVSNFTNDILQPALDIVKGSCVDTFNIIGDEWDRNGNRLLDMWGKVRDSIKDIWTNLYDTVLKPIWENILSAVDSLWQEHLKPLVASIVSFASKLGEAIMTVWNNFLAPLVNWLIDKVGPKLVERFKEIVSNIKTVLGVIIDAVKNIFDALGGLLDFIIGVFTNDWEKAWTGLKTFFKGIWDAIWGIVKYSVNLIIDGLNALWSGIYNAVKGIVNTLGSIVKTAGDLLGKDWGFSMPSKPPLIPKLARGGIIDQPTLAMVGEAGKEAVVPLENTAFADSIAEAIMRVLLPLFSSGKGMGKNNDDSNTTIVLKIGEYELGRVTVGAINKYHNVIGKVELEV